MQRHQDDDGAPPPSRAALRSSLELDVPASGRGPARAVTQMAPMRTRTMGLSAGVNARQQMGMHVDGLDSRFDGPAIPTALSKPLVPPGRTQTRSASPGVKPPTPALAGKIAKAWRGKGKRTEEKKTEVKEDDAYDMQRAHESPYISEVQARLKDLTQGNVLEDVEAKPETKSPASHLLSRVLLASGIQSFRKEVRVDEISEAALYELVTLLWLGGRPVQDFMLVEHDALLKQWSMLMQTDELSDRQRLHVIRIVSELCRDNKLGKAKLGELGWVQILSNQMDCENDQVKKTASNCMFLLLVKSAKNQTTALSDPDLQARLRYISALFEDDGGQVFEDSDMNPARETLFLLDYDLEQGGRGKFGKMKTKVGKNRFDS